MAHHYQESDVACGVAALQMVLEDAGHVAPPASVLADALGTDLHGTRPAAFERFLTDHGIAHVAWYGDVTIADLRDLLTQHALLICYQSKELRVGHFACVTDITADAVEVDDPWFGPCKCLPLADFEAAWESRPHGTRPLHHWVIGVRRVTTSSDPLAS